MVLAGTLLLFSSAQLPGRLRQRPITSLLGTYTTKTNSKGIYAFH